MKIKGSEITVGTKLRWLKEVGQYYRATHEVVWTVESVHHHWLSGKAVMTFREEWPVQHEWYIDEDKDYETESQNRVWLEGNPNNPL